MSLNLNQISCPKCGGKLQENGPYQYKCAFCERVWEKEIDDTFEKILGGVEAALLEQRAADLARIKRALYDETHKEFISDKEVKKLCTDILNHYDDEDFYAKFYLATCGESRTALSSFFEDFDVNAHIDDIPDILDYLITGLRDEWILTVGQIIEAAYKSRDTALYSEYRNKFEDMAIKLQDALYEPSLHRDVFVMYSGKDMSHVMKTVSMLENEYELTCFVAARNLRHGAGSTDRYKDAIHEAIKNSDVFLLISTQNSRTRQCEVYDEILHIMDKFPGSTRVEYLVDEYKGYGVEKKFKEFFSGVEPCRTLEQTAERISEVCDELTKKNAVSHAPTPRAAKTASTVQKPVSRTPKAAAPAAPPKASQPKAVDQDPLTALLVKARRLSFLKKKEEARAAYEEIIDDHPDDIRAYIGIVETLSDNFSNPTSTQVQPHIDVINELFGEEAALKSDESYSSFIEAYKEAQKQVKEEKARRLKEERLKREKEEAERRQREEAERKKREAEEAEKKRKEEAERKKRESSGIDQSLIAEIERKQRQADEAERRRKEEDERRSQSQREAEERKRREEREAEERRAFAEKEAQETKKRTSKAPAPKRKPERDKSHGGCFTGFILTVFTILFSTFIIEWGFEWANDLGNTKWSAMFILAATSFAIVHFLKLGSGHVVRFGSIVTEIFVLLEVYLLASELYGYSLFETILLIAVNFLIVFIFPISYNINYSFFKRLFKSAACFGVVFAIIAGSKYFLPMQIEESLWNLLWVAPLISVIATVLTVLGTRDRFKSNDTAVAWVLWITNIIAVITEIGVLVSDRNFDFGVLLLVILQIFVTMIAINITKSIMKVD